MLEQIVAFLTGLAVAAASAVGLGTATTASQGVDTPEIAAARTALARQEAAERLAEKLEQVLVSLDEADELADLNGEVGTADAGLETAATAIAESPAWEAASGNADDGLDTAHTAVTTAPTGGDDTEDAGPPEGVPPVTPPTAPPADVPSGQSDAPGGRP